MDLFWEPGKFLLSCIISEIVKVPQVKSNNIAIVFTANDSYIVNWKRDYHCIDSKSIDFSDILDLIIRKRHSIIRCGCSCLKISYIHPVVGILKDPITADDPTLTFNTIHRHQSMLVRTRVASNKSPWLSRCDINDEHLIAISHGEGRFVCSQTLLNQLIDNGQIATQYVDLTCQPTMDLRYNPNGSVMAIEGITSPDGRVFGKMGHSERYGERLYKNVTGDKYQPIFEGGVNYFKL